MRTYKPLIFVSFLICTLSSYSQEKKDSKIIAHVTDTANLFNRLSMAFIDNGYAFENRDQQLGFIATGEKSIPKTPTSMKIRAVIKDSTITFTGTLALDIQMTVFGSKSERSFEPVQYIGEKNASYKVCWREMEGIAKQFGPLAYSK
jgi:hypothetical protein